MEENKITLITKTELIKKVGEEFSKYIVQVDGLCGEEYYLIQIMPLINSQSIGRIYYDKNCQICLDNFKEYAYAHPDLQYRIVNIFNSFNNKTDFQKEIYDWLVNEGFDVILINERIVEKFRLPFVQEEV